MKKVAVILACLALAGCTKDVRIASGGDVPVGFTPMTGNIATKSECYGSQNGTYTLKNGSNYEKFTTFAKYTAAAGDNPQTDGVGVEFFPATGIECVHGGSGANDYWAPSTAYYWPFSGYLSFHAISPSNLSPYQGAVSHNWSSGFTITGFQAGTYSKQQVDILYSDFEFKKQRKDYTPLSGIPYDEDADIGYDHKGVNLNFHHALSLIQFCLKTGASYSSGNVTYTFATTGIQLKNVDFKGEFHENRTSAADNTFANAPAGSVTAKEGNSATSTPYWIPTDTGASDETSYTVSEISTTATLAGNDVGSPLLVMPQHLSHPGTGNSVQVAVTYNFTYQVGSEPALTYTGTKTIVLAGLSGQAGGSAATINQWLINHKYTYTIVFHLDPLIFDPNVEAFVEVSDINVDLPFHN